MLISEAFAQGLDAATSAPAAPSPLWNLGMLAVMVALFYLLLIRPQQKRFKEHSALLSALSKGDAVVTGGGLVGVVDKVVSDTELVIDLGNGMKVTALRSTITGKAPEGIDVAKKPAAVNKAPAKAVVTEKKAAAPKAPAKKAAPKKTAAKKTTAKAKTATKK